MKYPNQNNMLKYTEPTWPIFWSDCEYIERPIKVDKETKDMIEFKSNIKEFMIKGNFSSLQKYSDNVVAWYTILSRQEEYDSSDHYPNKCINHVLINGTDFDRPTTNGLRLDLTKVKSDYSNRRASPIVIDDTRIKMQTDVLYSLLMKHADFNKVFLKAVENLKHQKSNLIERLLAEGKDINDLHPCQKLYVAHIGRYDFFWKYYRCNAV